MSDQPEAIIFSDGACSGNPGPGGWGIVAWLAHGPRLVERGGGAPSTTNNVMELEAACQALVLCRDLGLREWVRIYADSTYVLKGLSEWAPRWQKNGWRRADGEAVLNQEAWKRLLDLKAQSAIKKVEWLYVPGHADVVGNERADTIAVAYSLGQTPTLYEGPYEASGHDLLTGLDNLPPPRAKKKSSSTPKGPGSYYLSLLGGEVQRHQTWAECEARVKGKSGARFKKLGSTAEEAAVLASWGHK